MHRHAISKNEINALPIKSYTGAIHLVDSDVKMHAAARDLCGEKALGFDTETRPAFKKGESYLPSIIQFASESAVYIFRLSRISSYEPLARILSSARPVKAGIAIHDDIRKLQELFPFKPAGFVELAGLAARAGIKHAGVRGLAAALFGYRISKSTKCSRWDADTLSREQITYAATDAWMTRQIYFALSNILREKIK